MQLENGNIKVGDNVICKRYDQRLGKFFEEEKTVRSISRISPCGDMGSDYWVYTTDKCAYSSVMVFPKLEW